MSYNTEHYLTNGNKTFQESFNRVTQALLDGTLTGVILKDPILTKPIIERESPLGSPTAFLRCYADGSATSPAYISHLHSQGTKASPSPTQNNNYCGFIPFWGYGTGGFDGGYSAYILAQALETFAGTSNRAMGLEFGVRAAGDASSSPVFYLRKNQATFGSTESTGSIAVKMGAMTATTGTFAGAVSGVTSLSMSGALSGGTTATFSGDISSTGGKFGSNNANNYINLVTNGNGECATRGSWFINVNSNGGNSVPYFGIYYNSSTANIYFKAEQTGKVTLTNPTTTTSKIVSGAMATVTADKNIASSTTETTLIGTMAGINKTIGASHLTAGKTYRFKLTGYIGNTGTPTIRIKIKLGSTVILDSTAVTMVTITGSQMFKVEGEITCRTTGASGTIIGQADFQYYSTQTTVNRISIVSTSTVTYDTTAIGAFDITAQWGTNSASNTITSTNFILEEIL